MYNRINDENASRCQDNGGGGGNGGNGNCNGGGPNECGVIAFPELRFEQAGTYAYTVKELTPSGDGWHTDRREHKVTVKVCDDGRGNLIADVEYPGGFPQFVNEYRVQPVCVLIEAFKIAVGAPLPCGRFEFGLFDGGGKMISKAKNGAAR